MDKEKDIVAGLGTTFLAASLHGRQKKGMGDRRQEKGGGRQESGFERQEVFKFEEQKFEKSVGKFKIYHS